MIYFLLCLLGFILGLLFARYYIHKKSTYGLMIINEDDPEFATCGFKFESSIEEIKSHQYLILNIKSTRDNQSH